MRDWLSWACWRWSTLVAAVHLWLRPDGAQAASVTAVAAGGSHTCALTVAGELTCWRSNAYGQLATARLGSVASAAASGQQTCALTTMGGVKCWGDNTYGQLGNGTTGGGPTPVDVVWLSSDVAAVAAGDQHACALTTAGGVKCWGANFTGQLGDGSKTNRAPAPVDVVGLASGVNAV